MIKAVSLLTHLCPVSQPQANFSDTFRSSVTPTELPLPEETDEELDLTPPPRRRRLRRKTADPSCTLRCSCCNIPNSYSTIKSCKDCNGDLLCGSCETFYDCGYCNSTICRLCYTIHPDRCNRQHNHQPTTLEFDSDIGDYIGDGTVTLPQPDND